MSNGNQCVDQFVLMVNDNVCLDVLMVNRSGLLVSNSLDIVLPYGFTRLTLVTINLCSNLSYDF